MSPVNEMTLFYWIASDLKSLVPPVPGRFEVENSRKPLKLIVCNNYHASLLLTSLVLEVNDAMICIG